MKPSCWGGGPCFTTCVIGQYTRPRLTLDEANFAEVAPLSEVRDDLVIRGNLHLAVSASNKPKLRGSNLIP